MRLSTLLFSLAGCHVALAARPFLNEPDTGITTYLTYLGNSTPAEASGTLMPLDDMIAIPDFEFAARAYMPSENYSYYRTGAAGEFSMFLVIPFLDRNFQMLTIAFSVSCEFGDL